MQQKTCTVLLVEDDEDDYLIVADILNEVVACKIVLDWVDKYDEALLYLDDNEPDILLVDYNLQNSHTGLDLVRKMKEKGTDIPSVMITGQEKEAIGSDEELAVLDGYVKKDVLTPELIEDMVRSVME
jgi:CheY-like chemotaxis protein